MKTIINSLFILLFLSVSSQEIHPDILDIIRETVNVELNASGAPGAVVAVVKDGKLIYNEPFGIRNSKTKEPVTTKTLFATASVTKSVTTMGLLTACEEKGIDLHEPIGNILKNLDPKLSQLSMHQILSQSAGILDYWPTRKKFKNDIKLYFDHYGDKLVCKELEGVFSYTNFGHVMAGLLLKELNDSSFEEAVSTYVLEPLQMKNTTHDIDTVKLKEYSSAHKGGQLVKHQYVFPVIQPSASMFSTSHDLAKFAICFMNQGKLNDKQVIPKSVIEKMSTGYIPLGAAHNYFGYPDSKYNYAMISFNYKGIDFIGHPGESTSQNILFAMAPKYNTAFIIMSNTGFYPFIKTFEKLADSFLPVAMEVVPYLNKSVELNEYAGTFYTPDIYDSRSNTIDTYMKKNQLFIRLSEEEVYPLTWISKDSFSYPSNHFKFPVEIIFYRNNTGHIAFLNNFWTTAIKK